ncbi:hypothetical protein AnigIFM63604_001943 [Aspergillus niger]|uniref:Uncharacterized protein n=1 Tax=Aspergillus niger TaxID=5061 RepID=A0A9W5ZYA7_ASPNG|nr:hypothetical protein CBS133816_1609 [Aspergillus niger]KAI2926238.1 hypothetical protein CBS147320_6013 [Aspergillus niger]KAI2929828.1 hypothetical protein CBS147321_10744 [Aspergillus niger]KAI2957702.1 hypothetical protein CBS147324_10686 [Aspergillus niger]KAI3038283.1 hypothetical protein CBS147352_10744 [Aspergillus niger]
MHLRSCLVGSVLALGANAFLVIPEVEEAIAPEGDFPPLHPLEVYAPKKEQVELACTECPFREVSEDGKVSWTDGFQTSLLVDFSTENGFLLANGRQIFPPPPPTLITAVQRRTSDGVETEPIPLGYAVEEMPLPTPPEDPMDLVAVRFTVLDLDSRPVPLDTVALTLLHDPSSGELYIAKSEIEEATPDRVSWKQCRGKPKCLRKLLFDRMRALFAAAKARMLGMGPKPKGSHCGGPHGLDFPPPPRPHHHHHHHPDDKFDPERMPPMPPMEGEEAEFHGHMDKFDRPHHHHHMHHMHHGKWERTVHRVVRFIVVPAVLGVLAGLAASALGMLVGQIVVFMWQRFRRSTPKKSLEQGTVSEKQGLMMESEELPPAYSDEEAVVEEVSSAKN